MTFVPGALPDRIERRRPALEAEQMRHAVTVLDAVIAARKAHDAFGSPPAGSGDAERWQLSMVARHTMRAADKAVAEYRARWPR